MAGADPVFRRVLLKISGEALMGPLEYGTDPERVQQIAAQVVRCRAGDHDIGEGPRPQHIGADEVHQLVLPRAARRDGCVLAARPFDHDLLDAPDARLVLRERAALRPPVCVPARLREAQH